MHPLACRVEGGGVVVFLADVETDEYVEPVLVHIALGESRCSVVG